MAKPPLPLIVQWRDLAQEGRFYTDIAKGFPDYTAKSDPPLLSRKLRCQGSGSHTKAKALG